MRLPRASLALALGRDLVFAVIACAAAIIVSLSIQLEMTEAQLRESSLDAAARYLASHLEIAPDGTAQLATPPGSSWSSIGYPAIVFDRDGRIVYQRPDGLDPTVVDALGRERVGDGGHELPLGTTRFFTLALGSKRIVGGALRAAPGGDGRVVEVFKDENAPDVLVDDVVRLFPYRSAEVLLPLVALLLLAGGWILRRRMRPLAAVSAAAERVGPSTVNARLPERDLPAELRPIARAVNGAFERLARAAEAQREFLRRAAHQLRTPMTVLRARVDSLDDAAAAAQLRGDVDELARVVSQLLQLSELDALPDRGNAVADLGAVAQSVRRELAPRAAGDGQAIELVRPDGPTLAQGDPNIIEVAVRNLVENALQHSPRDATVWLRVRPEAAIEVTDSGAGIADEMRDKIFEPFRSGDPNSGRAGLGLTIVRRVAELYGATVALAAAPGGGAIFTLQFRPAAAGASGAGAAAGQAARPANLAKQGPDGASDAADP